jgi:hypothetical protein
MLVRVEDAVVVGPTGDFGSNREVPVVGDGGAGAALRTARGGIIVRPNDFNPERIILNDAIGGPTLPDVDVGDSYPGSLIGVIDYSFANFKLQVISLPPLSDNGLIPEVADEAGLHQLAIGTFNVENLAATDPQSKYDRLAGLIVDTLRSPDVIGIEEVQDDNATTAPSTTGTWMPRRPGLD